MGLQVPKETDSFDVKEETEEEEGYIKAVEMTNAVTEASNQASNQDPNKLFIFYMFLVIVCFFLEFYLKTVFGTDDKQRPCIR